jgi:hypothetical protein
MPAHNNRGIVTLGDVTRTAVAVERLGKHVSAETNSRNSGRTVFSVQSVPRGYKGYELGNGGVVVIELCESLEMAAE